MSSLLQGKTLDDLAQHLYDFLPGSPYPGASFIQGMEPRRSKEFSQDHDVDPA
jgi:hypothetical protein